MKDHISICVPTCHRNQMLERLLRKLAQQETACLFDFSVVVVDNDAAGSARETVMQLKDELGLDITYDIELEQTIPAVRNHALQLARGNFIGIIDDDEFPPRHWLLTIYKAIKLFDTDGALGPVHPFFFEQPPPWLVKSQFCERPVHRTGTLLHWNQTRTGNVLLKREVFDKHDLCFDPKFKTGGSDQQFFKQAMHAGCRFIAVEEAPVYEIVPPERWTKSYYLKRAMVNGFNSYRYSANQEGGLSRLLVPIKSIAAILAYLLVLPLCACVGSHLFIKYLEKGTYHLSRLFAILGIELVKKRSF
jgi:succinoglycan biosynthesis protein ExoM